MVAPRQRVAPRAASAIKEGYLLGVERDELDVEHVRLYGLLRPGTD